MRNRIVFFLLLLAGLVLFMPHTVVAWEHHPLFTRPVAATLPEVADAAPVQARSLQSFLAAVELDLAALLAEEENWARTNLPAYRPRPDALAFEATGTAGDIEERFFNAIRVNPEIKVPLYVSPLAGAKAQPVLVPSDVSILQDVSNLEVFDFLLLLEGDLVAPLDVVAAASNEPDYGMDIGLFEDNGTAFGATYGFGIQPFGNAHLDYGTQAPFHMGFYHESWIVYLFAPFLKECYPEYRIHLFKSLSQFAFEHDQDYWGWRFMGWGLHYLGDLSQPYHTAALPGYTTLQMLWVNLLDMLGFPRPQANAVQLASNRHVALETFEGIVLADAVRTNDLQDPTLAALLESRTIPPYSDSVPRARLAAATHALTMKMNRQIVKYMPAYFVNNPAVELGDIPQRYAIVDAIMANHGPGGVRKMEEIQAAAFKRFGTWGRSFVRAVLEDTR